MISRREGRGREGEERREEGRVEVREGEAREGKGEEMKGKGKSEGANKWGREGRMRTEEESRKEREMRK
jgi:hypothetical protein